MISKVYILFILGLFVGCVRNNSDNVVVKPEIQKISLNIDSVNRESISDPSSSKITCPNCGYAEVEKMPTEICLLKYKCKKCFHEIVPKKGDCCVFCSYGTVKCPSMQ